MSSNPIMLGRNLSRTRINAYERTILPNGSIDKKRPVRNGGWYGPFTEERLRNEIMHKLEEYAGQDYHYPFLITAHELNKKTEVHVDPVSFKRRGSQSEQRWVAVVNSEKECKILP